MIPTLVITLREGLEAALIVGIVAAFLVREGRRDALRAMWIGVAVALVLCLGVAVALRIAGESLPQREQEGLETIVGLIAVAMISYMVVWMRRHSRELKHSLEGSAAQALAAGSAMALAVMAFLAVLREGFETSVFLLAVFQDTSDPATAGAGAVLGLVIALALGAAIYRGGVRINLSRFFRFTGIVLVLVAAGLLATSLHTAHEAGWFNGLQAEAVDLSWLVKPGTVIGSLLTGMLGLQPNPTVGEATAYLLYAIPMGAYVLWPQRRPTAPAPARAAATATLALLAVALIAAGCGSNDSASSEPGATTLAYTISDAGCDPAESKAPAGPVNFEVTNDGSSSVTELEIMQGDAILGERENISPGLTATFSLNLEQGDYTVYCPNGTEVEKGTLTVSGEAKGGTTPKLEAAADEYRDYVAENTELLVTRTKALAAALDAGDVEQAKRLYPVARIPYERVEPVAESFGGLDPEIDAREGDVPKADWTGFHPIEKALWIDGSAAGLGSLSDALVADVERLDRKAAGLDLQAAQIANGATALLDEVSASKITGEEERYSHTDLVDFDANVDGSRAAFEAVEPILRAADPALATEITKRFDQVDRALAPYRDGDGYVSYTELNESDQRKLAQAVDALAEPLSQVAAQIVS
jgi:high-affinity iron transporter